jgi:predicted MPP superfamily phosphohydrolase
MEDFGNNKNLVEAKKKELNNKDWFEINYLVNEKNIIVYEKKLKVKGINNASSKVGVEHVSYHVYAEQIIDGISYELRNSDDGNDKEMVRWIAKSIKSFKPLKTKQ